MSIHDMDADLGSDYQVQESKLINHPDCDEACMFQCQMEKKFAQEQSICPECGKPTQQGQCFYGCKQPAQEPVAYLKNVGEKGVIDFAFIDEIGAYPVYTYPTQPLSDEEAVKLFIKCLEAGEGEVLNVISSEQIIKYARAIQAHGIGVTDR